MSLAESFLSTAKDVLMMAENVKRLDTRVDRLATDLASVDRRLMRIEIMIDLAKPAPRKHKLKELPE